VEALAAEASQKKRLVETIETIDKTDIHALPILKELTERIPLEAWLRTLSMDKQGLEITGQAGAANQLIPLLENSPYLTSVEFTAPVTKAGDKEQFRIKAAWKTLPKTAEVTAKGEPPPTPPGGKAQPPAAEPATKPPSATAEPSSKPPTGPATAESSKPTAPPAAAESSTKTAPPGVQSPPTSATPPATDAPAPRPPRPRSGAQGGAARTPQPEAQGR